MGSYIDPSQRGKANEISKYLKKGYSPYDAALTYSMMHGKDVSKWNSPRTTTRSVSPATTSRISSPRSSASSTRASISHRASTIGHRTHAFGSSYTYAKAMSDVLKPLGLNKKRRK